jgi:hypothetical protein
VTVDQLQRAVKAVVERRQIVEKKELALVVSLNEALKRLGYAVVPARARVTAMAGSRARRGRGRR